MSGPEPKSALMPKLTPPGGPPWFITTTKSGRRDVSTGPLASSFVCLLVQLTHSLTPHCSLYSHPLLYSFASSLTPELVGKSFFFYEMNVSNSYCFIPLCRRGGKKWKAEQAQPARKERRPRRRRYRGKKWNPSRVFFCRKRL